MSDSTERDIDPELLERFLAGECTPAEEATVRAWAARAAGDPNAPAELRALLPRVLDTLPVPTVDTAAFLKALRGRIARQGPASPRADAPAARMPGLRPIAPYIAFLAAVCLIGTALVVLRRPHTGLASREYATQPGQRESVTLADGTRFTLAPASRVSVPIDYAAGDRAVTLEGHALFNVVHDAAHPFSVTVRNAVVTDIGTQFDVRAYTDDPAVHVALIEGRINLTPVGVRVPARSTPALTRTLGPGDVATIGDTTLAIVHGADVAALSAWTRGELAFEGATVRAVAAELSRWYGANVRVAAGGLGDRLFSGSFPPESLDAVLVQMAPVIGARIERAGSTVTLSPRQP